MEPMREAIESVLISEEQIQRRVKELGEQISHDYEGCGRDLILICILKGAVVFFADLARAITLPLEMEFMGISSYGNTVKTSGIVRITKDIDTSITDKHVLIAEDIMDSGLTLSHMTRLLSSRNPASMRICCLLDKPERRECEITPDYCGFVIPNKFVVGYGLDYAGIYRNLPYVGVL
ncbi:MAG: hypoxanthine phosphoribosyltransferase, partial [Clostridia bacterium]|nr:hypoxanthine phosphoribosyltransferase [Clostridia bacterium]